MRWGIVGYGWVARDFMVPAIREAGGTVVAVADPAMAGDEASEDDNMSVYSNVEQLLEAEECDIIYVATPNDAHADAVIAAAEAGVAVLCEKPIAASLEDAERMAEAVERSGIFYGTAFDQRHHPAHKRIAELVEKGDIGRPIAIRILYACWVDPLWNADGRAAENWRADPARAGGGAVIDLALHGLDLSQYLLGEPLERLDIVLQRRVHDYAVDDGGMLQGATRSGVLVQSHVAYNCAEVLPRRRLEILGETGAIVALDTMGQTAGGAVRRRCGTSGEETAIDFDEHLSPFTAQARAAMDAVSGKSHDFSIVRDLRLMRLFDKAYREAQACL